jgi:hypothetical protein
VVEIPLFRLNVDVVYLFRLSNEGKGVIRDYSHYALDRPLFA